MQAICLTAGQWDGRNGQSRWIKDHLTFACAIRQVARTEDTQYSGDRRLAAEAAGLICESAFQRVPKPVGSVAPTGRIGPVMCHDWRHDALGSTFGYGAAGKAPDAWCQACATMSGVHRCPYLYGDRVLDDVNPSPGTHEALAASYNSSDHRI